MPRKRYSTKQIVTKLRQAEVELGRGLRMPQVCKKLGISEQTYYRWRKAALDAVHQVGLDHVTGVGLALDPGPQLRRLDVGAMSPSQARAGPGYGVVRTTRQGAVAWPRPAGARARPPARPAPSGRVN